MLNLLHGLQHQARTATCMPSLATTLSYGGPLCATTAPSAMMHVSPYCLLGGLRGVGFVRGMTWRFAVWAALFTRRSWPHVTLLRRSGAKRKVATASASGRIDATSEKVRKRVLSEPCTGGRGGYGMGAAASQARWCRRGLWFRRSCAEVDDPLRIYACTSTKRRATRLGRKARQRSWKAGVWQAESGVTGA